MLEYRQTYAAIWRLNMKQGGDGWHNIGHECLSGGCTVLNTQTHENQRNMGVVWIPLAMVGSPHAVGIEIRLQSDGNITATLPVVTIHDTRLHILRNANAIKLNTLFISFIKIAVILFTAAKVFKGYCYRVTKR